IRPQYEPDLMNRPLFGRVMVGGWAVDSDRVIRVEIFCDGERIGEAQMGLPRADVFTTFPQLPASDRSGYEFLWNTDDVAPGPHELGIRAVNANGGVRVRTLSVRIEQPLRLRVEVPQLQPGLQVKGSLFLAGWATGPHPIERIEVLCDGER